MHGTIFGQTAVILGDLVVTIRPVVRVKESRGRIGKKDEGSGAYKHGDDTVRDGIRSMLIIKCFINGR